MNRLVIHKNLTQKNLFRVLGGSIYKNRHWEIARTKEELVAYLTQFQPDLISIGPLEDMDTLEVAKYIRLLYITTKSKIPAITCVEREKMRDVRETVYNGKTSQQTRQVS